MRHDSPNRRIDSWMRLGSVTVYCEYNYQRLSSLDPAVIGKAVQEVAVPCYWFAHHRFPPHFFDVPGAPPTITDFEAVGTGRVNLERTGARVDITSDGHEARFLGVSPHTGSYNLDLQFPLFLSTSPAYSPPENPSQEEHKLLIAHWRDPEMLGQAMLNIFAMAGPPVNQGMQSVFDPPAPKRRTKLHQAAESGDATALPKGQRGKVDPQDTAGTTPLLLAAGGGHEAVVLRLLELGANLNHQDHRGRTALHHAAAGGHTGVITALLAAGAHCGLTGEDGTTALHLAAAGGRKEAVERLLAGGAEPNAADALYASTPLHLAARGNHTDLTAVLTVGGADVNTPNEAGRTPLHVAAAYGHAAMARSLLEAGADVNRRDYRGETPLHRPAFYQHLEVITLLLEAGADAAAADERGDTPLHVAAGMNRDQAVRLLLDNGAGVEAANAEGLTPLDTAIVNLHNTFPALVKHLELTGRPGSFAELPWRAREHNGEAAEALLEHGASIDPMRLPVGDRHVLWPHLTPDDLIHSHGDIDFSKLIDLPREFWAKVAEQDAKQGGASLPWAMTSGSLLHDAAVKGMPVLAEKLLQSGVSPMTGVRGFFSPLHLAAVRGDREMVDLLLRWGADLEMNGQNSTSRRYDRDRNLWDSNRAALTGKEYAVELSRLGILMETPLDLASEFGEAEMVRHLLQLGAAPLPDASFVDPDRLVFPRTYDWILAEVERQWGASKREALEQVFREFGLID